MKLALPKADGKGLDLEGALARAIELFGKDLPPSEANVSMPEIGYRRKRTKRLTKLEQAVRAARKPRAERPPKPMEWDRVWREQKLLIEIQGGIFARGKSGHKGAGAERDYEKLNLATIAGYRTLYCSPNDLTTWEKGAAFVELIRKALEA